MTGPKNLRSANLQDQPRPREGKPRILIVTPEIASLPSGLPSPVTGIKAKGGGLADVAALLVDALTERNADVHVALPHFRRVFGFEPSSFQGEDWRLYTRKPPNTQLHLAEDSHFYYRDRVYGPETPNVALAFQREVINNIIPRVEPDLIHCHDWMTGLIPGAARRLNIPCIFTIHNVHTERLSLAHMEHMGIDAADFWQSLYLERFPWNYEESREHNPANLLASGIFASRFVNTVSPTFLDEIIEARHGGLPHDLRQHLAHMRSTGCAKGILNAPHPSYNSATDSALVQCYDPDSAVEGKAANKIAFQERTGLTINPDAPLFLWPSRLDPLQKGCQFLTDILYQLICDYAEAGLQVALVADGEFQCHFRDIVELHGVQHCVTVCDFDEDLSRLGYAASDFSLVPSDFEPCGLAQMIASIYGSLPIVRATGGLLDTVSSLDSERGVGNGFVFETADSTGLRWAIDQAMFFYCRSPVLKAEQVARVMRQARDRFRPDAVVECYLDAYNAVAESPLT